MILSSVCLSILLFVCYAVHCGTQGLTLYSRVSTTTLLIHFFRHFPCWMYRLAAKHGDRLKSKSRLQFETVNKYILMLTAAIPENGLSYTVRSAITATAELLVWCCLTVFGCYVLVAMIVKVCRCYKIVCQYN